MSRFLKRKPNYLHKGTQMIAETGSNSKVPLPIPAQVEEFGLKVRFVCLLGPLLLGVICFGPVLFQNRQFAFRDAADFYYPLYQRVQQEWEAGRFPLWEPEENGGMPLLGNPTAAVLYPGKLVFAFMNYAWAARWYVIGHVALAYLSMLWLLRGWGLSLVAATFGAMAYAFGAPVLLQYANVIFLVGAAWMPLGILASDRWLRLGQPRALTGLAAVLAMQILGGDPQAAYIILFVASVHAIGVSLAETRFSNHRRRLLVLASLVVLYALLYGWTFLQPWLVRSTGIERWPSVGQLAFVCWMIVGAWVVVRFWRHRDWGLEFRLLGLAGAGFLAFLIAALQILPSYEFISHSLRVAHGSEIASIYSFSLHPARIVELLWPGFFGGIVGGNHHWLVALPPTHDFQIWIESVYVGGATLLLALLAHGCKGSLAYRGWLTFLLVAGAILAIGNYASPSFWARVFQSNASNLKPDAGDGMVAEIDQSGTGSPYWFLASVLPGFGSFRYPGKFAVLASLGLCGLAALGFEQLLSRRGLRLLRSVALASAIISLLLLVWILLPVGDRALTSYLARHSEWTTTVFGPLDASMARHSLLWAFVQGLVVSGLAFLFVGLVPERPVAASVLMLVSLALDLGLANRSLIHTVPQSVFDSQPRAIEAIQKAEANDPSPGPFRIHRMKNWSPAAWLSEHSTNRIEEILRWERDSVRIKYAIPYRYSYTYAVGTTEWLDQVLFFDSFSVALDGQAIKNFGLSPGQRIRYFTRRGFDLWNTRYFVLPARLSVGSAFRGVWSFLPDTTEIDPPPGSLDGPHGDAKRKQLLIHDDVQVLRNEAAYPRAWIVHRARFAKPIVGRTLDERRPLMNEILYQDDELWHVDGRRVVDPRAVAWIEAEPSDRPGYLKKLSGGLPDPEESVHVDKLEPQRVEMTANLKSPGLVILADIYYPGWELTVDGVPTPVERVNRAMRGAFVSAGTHKLTYVYRPISVKLGAVLSALGIVLSLALMYYGAGGVDKVFTRQKTLPISNPDPQ